MASDTVILFDVFTYLLAITGGGYTTQQMLSFVNVTAQCLSKINKHKNTRIIDNIGYLRKIIPISRIIA